MKLRQIKIYICALIALCAISCSRKSIPTNSYRPVSITVQSDCDSAVHAALEKVRNILALPGAADSCELLPIVVDLTDRLNTAQKKVVSLQEQILQMPAAPVTVFNGKVKNSFNDIQKNNNNTTELYRLKNSLLARDSSIAQLQAENAALGAKLKDKTKVVAKQGSAIGEGNTVTTKKMNWWWIFLAGMLTWCILQNVVFRVLKTYFPFLNFLP